MIKIEKFQVVGWEHAIRGMRNPKNSWEKSDSQFKATATTQALDFSENPDGEIKDMFVEFDALGIGPNDHKLMMDLAGAGPVHGKFRRMIVVYMDITAPLYWWKEFDTYKVGTVANSCSTMHKIHAKEFWLADFSHEHLIGLWDDDSKVLEPYIDVSPYNDDSVKYSSAGVMNLTIEILNKCRQRYLETKDKKYWWQLIQLLPNSYNQKRTIMLSYEVLANIYQYRKNHKLDEWVELCKWIETLPYSEIITGEKEKK